MTRTRARTARPAAAPAEGAFAATVMRVDFGNVVIEEDSGARHEARVRGRLMGPTKALGNAVVVGDRVTAAREADRIVITDVEPRRNSFSRRAAGERPAQQVVAANLDQVVLVASLAEPAFNPGLSDRILAQARHDGLPARVVLNKVDLDRAHEAGAILEAYARAGHATHAACARSGEGVDAVREACRGARSLFVGHSGVGKSTLLNALDPGLDLLSGHVNLKTGKGRHTTTAAWLLRSAGGLELIDTPGVRSFGLWGVGPADLAAAYPEFEAYLGRCRFGDCGHRTEPGCAIRAAVESGVIDARRHASYVQLRAELEQESRLEETRGRRGRL
jgi:ribosome biogenesis GTPase